MRRPCGRPVVISALSLLFVITPVGANCQKRWSVATPSNPNILERGRSELAYFASAGAAQMHGVISGQWASPPAAWPEAYQLFVNALATRTGRHVAILGSDYFGAPGSTAEQSRQLDALLISQWKAGGFVTLTWSAPNPWYGGKVGVYCRDAPNPCVRGNLSELTRPGTIPGARFKADMDRLADDLDRLQSAGVVVLLRPFHEMNGNWFWWGAQTTNSPMRSDFVSLWRYTYRYLTETRKLNNLLWVFSPENADLSLAVYPSWGGIIQPATYYYPGKNYVDITGIDLYDDALWPPPPVTGVDARDGSIPSYSQMIALGKPFGLTEFGPGNPQTRSFDFDLMIRKIIKAYPEIGFFMAWQDDPDKNRYYSIISNARPGVLMTDDLVINREHVEY